MRVLVSIANATPVGAIATLSALHARACDAGVADPLKLARWLVKFRFADQDFFEVDPVRYAMHARRQQRL